MTPRTKPLLPELLTPAEVARLFRVDPKTVTRWAKSGKLPSIWTIGGHRRYSREAIEKFLADQSIINPNPLIRDYRPESLRRRS